MEYFSPTAVDRVDREKNVRRVSSGRPLPWDPDELRKAEKSKSRNNETRNDRVWRHTVFAGVFDIARVREVLENALRAPDDEQDLDGRVGGRSALLSFTLDEKGHLLKDSITLSSCAWAVSRTLTVGPESDSWLDGFEDDQKQLLDYLFEIGDGRILVDSHGGDTSGQWRSRVAGSAARVALDVVAGGISSLPAVASILAQPVVGPAGAKIVEGVGGALADDAISKITAARDAGKGGAGGVTADPVPPALGAKPLTVDDLAAITRWVAETLGIADALKPDEIRVKSYTVPLRSAGDVSTAEFLNSFYADDLEQVVGAIDNGDIGVALREYLRADESIDMARRVDLRRSPRTILRALEPEAMPSGRWPGEPGKPLALSQQFAINTIFHHFRESGAGGVYAVNGPPGTGKTTMLRDLIAALVVERAAQLAKLSSARQVFAKEPLTWDTEDTPTKFKRSIHPLKPSLTGFEIVVASSNNGAVENVTLEIPETESIDPRSFPDADYLSSPATILTDTACWGAVAARLGKRNYRREFTDRFWWGNPRKDKDGHVRIPDHRGLHHILKDLDPRDCKDQEKAALPWGEARKRFNAAVEDVRRLAHGQQSLAEALGHSAAPDDILASLRKRAYGSREYVTQLQARLGLLRQEIDEVEDTRERAAAAVIDASKQLASARATAERAYANVRTADAELRNHIADKPGLLRRFCMRNALRNWKDDHQPLASALNYADSVLTAEEESCRAREADLSWRQHDLHACAQAGRELQAQLAQCDRDLRHARSAIGSADQAVRDREETLRLEAERLDRARRRQPRTIPGTEWNADPDDRDAMEARERSSPWMDEEFAAARSRVFLAALDLHRAVLAAEPKLAWDNLRAAIDVADGTAPRNLRPDKALAAWQMIFFVVPVISTTFASLSRMFAPLSRETLGWLFIDEAGQAAPQQAAGALWRSQRAVVVGDPLQLEPVVTLPWSGQKRLCRHFGVDLQWAPRGASVQSVADRLNTFGTWLPQPDGQGYAWVGSPLRVHRRCDPLMFEVSNQIAYDNMMVYGVNRADKFDLVTRSIWLDVPALPSGDKWNPAEGEYVMEALRTVRERIGQEMRVERANAGTDLPAWGEDEKAWQQELARRTTEKVFVISPFRDVVHGLEDLAGQKFPSGSWQIGTVHTTQGKEADIVVLVLGTATEGGGSRQWASKTPNLLNVAVTRARRRLIVVGDFQNWSQCRHFRELAEHRADGLLPVVDASTWRLARLPGSTPRRRPLARN